MPRESQVRRLVDAYRRAVRFAEEQPQSDKGVDWPAERERCRALAGALDRFEPEPEPEPADDDAE